MPRPDDASSEQPAYRWSDVLTSVIEGQDLTVDQTGWAMAEILSGNATPSQIAGLVVALRAKGETVDEVQGMVDTMYEFATTLDIATRAVDIVGTGADRANTVNISTMASLVTAGAGIPVVKHGNRSASSMCGTADVLEYLGVVLDAPTETVVEMVDKVGITFCFAPRYHSALRFSAVPRKELGVKTVFNFIGPLANPARPSVQAVGCADLSAAPVLAGVFARRGAEGFVFRGDDGLDEITTTTTTQMWGIHDGRVEHGVLDPADLGVRPARPEDLRGDEVAYNAQVVRDLLAGREGPVRDAVLLNAAAAITAYDRTEGDLATRMGAGLDRAREAVDSGAAAGVLEAWVNALGGTPR